MKYTISLLIIGVLLFFTAVTLSAQTEQFLEPEKIDPVNPTDITQPERITLENPERGIPAFPERITRTRTVKPATPEVPSVLSPPLETEIPDTSLALPADFEKRDLIAEAVLGAGYSNHIYASIFLAKLGPRPQFTLDFTHETMDGNFFSPDASFLHTRTDTITGDLNVAIDPVALDINGGFLELEKGLQDNRAFSSRITREVTSDIGLTVPFSEHFRIAFTPNLFYTNVTNRGDTTDRFSELLTSGILTGELLFDAGKVGLEARYDYRTFSAENDQPSPSDLHRINGSLFGRWLISDRFRTDLRAGWTYLSPGNHLFPFSVSLTAVPFHFLTVSLEGGLQHQPVNFYDLINHCRFSEFPGELNDNSGWFAGMNISFGLWQGAELSGGLTAVWNNYFSFFDTYNEQTGFFPLSTYNGITLEPTASFDWAIRPVFTFHTTWKGVYFVEEGIVPINTLTASADIHTPAEKIGATVDAGFEIGPAKKAQLPILGIGGYYRINKNIRLAMDAHDILSVLMTEEPRYTWKPYQDIGFQFTVSMKITF